MRVSTLLACLLCGLAPAAAALAQTIVEKAAKDEVEWVANGSPAMQRAFQRARATLPEFLELMRSKPAGVSGMALKVAVTEGARVEYFWVNEVIQVDRDFSGVLNNQPRVVFKHRLGERFSFTREQIADWMFYRNGGSTMVGNFTGCAILAGRPAQEAEDFKRRFGLACD